MTRLLALTDGSLLLTLYDTRCTLTDDASALACAAPWTGNALTIPRDAEAP